MSGEIQPHGPVPATAQSITVVQPAEAALSLNVGYLGAWAAAIVAIAAMLTLAYKLLTRDLSRDVRDVQHKVRNVTTRVDAIEHLRTNDIERIVRLETSISGLEKGVERVERTINDRFDTLAGSIREIRTVAPR